MIFVSLLYSQFPIKERISLDSSKFIVPLGWAPLRDWGHGVAGAAGFKFAYVEENIPEKTHPLSNLGFTDTSLKVFLEFFSFMTHDGHPIREFEERQEGTRYFQSMPEVDAFLATEAVHEVREGMPFVEANFAIRYWPKPPLGYISFEQAWMTFLAKEDKYRDMVSVHCARFAGPHNATYQVFNKETLRLFLLVTILEGLLGPRQKCPGVFSCSVCGPIQHQHNLSTNAAYWRGELERLLHFTSNTGYIDLIIPLRDEVRNSFAHTGRLLPDTEMVREAHVQGPHTRFLQLPDVIERLNTDSLARGNALMLLHDIVWFVLMNEFFPNIISTPWPDLGLIKQTSTG